MWMRSHMIMVRLAVSTVWLHMSIRSCDNSIFFGLSMLFTWRQYEQVGITKLCKKLCWYSGLTYGFLSKAPWLLTLCAKLLLEFTTSWRKRSRGNLDNLRTNPMICDNSKSALRSRENYGPNINASLKDSSFSFTQSKNIWQSSNWRCHGNKTPDK